MSVIELIVIASATVLGPILAVQAQKWIERATERRRVRRNIFHALMANRATRLNDDFVRSLNLIDLEYTKDKAVIDAWRTLFGTYTQGAGKDADEPTHRAWAQRTDDEMVALLSAMSKANGYEFTQEQLRRGVYYPKGRVDLENNQLAVLASLRDILEGRVALPMAVKEFPASPELIQAQIDLAQRGAAAYDEDGAVRVRVVQD